MLEKLKSKKLMAVLLVLIIAAGTAITAYAIAAKDVVATVNGEKITKDDLYQVLSKQYGSSVIKTLINNKIIEQEAEKENVKINEKDVKKELNKFIEEYGGEDTFNAALEQSGLTLADFKTDIRNYLKVKEILSPKIKITDKEMKEYFEENKDDYKQPEQVEASHILVDTEEKAKEIKAKLDKGEDFATLAKENSTDTASAEDGGKLGYFGKGEMTEEFEKAAFAMKSGEISEPVKTDYGYHIIKVTGKKEEKEANFKDVKDEIKEVLFDEKLNTEYATWLEKKNKSYKIKNTFES
ncbi:peptidylprolyl isomerase [Bacillus testis]|uniref:peptidylprolyl isomerase n=1 Tax=Bacillus testis TaxID=1622072 RepID=UPI00067ED4A9|nr:peptidylprolyl isomerase [Bacillus testis]